MPGARILLALIVFATALGAAAIDASNRYSSPRNPERAIRTSTELIVLHTTEAPARGSLIKLSERGECHFCVTEEGSVYRIVDRDREAFHAGRSMWNGKEDVDKFSIGIECVGYHDKEMPLVQLVAIRDLVKELKAMYHLSDDKVVCHSHVAYGAPNKWHKKKHRGRKQCGMLFAMPSVRRVLQLKSRPAFDADVKAKRLIVGDEYLEKVLYGKTDTMAAVYGKGSVVGVAPTAAKPAPAAESGGFFANLFRQQPQAAKPQPATRPVAPAVAKRPTTIAELKAQGFKLRGTVSPAMTASRIAGAKWNSKDTYYTIRNKVIPGNEINQAKIEKGMGVWTR